MTTVLFCTGILIAAIVWAINVIVRTPTRSSMPRPIESVPVSADSLLGSSQTIRRQQFRNYPVMTIDMVTGVTGSLSFQDCRRVIRLTLKEIRFKDSISRDDSIRSIHSHMVESEGFLIKCIQEYMTQLENFSAEARSLKRKINNKSTVESTELLKANLAKVQFDIDSTRSEIEDIKQELSDERERRLEHLVDNINRHVHGPNWREICNRPA